MSDLDDYERSIREVLDLLQREYIKACEPWIRKLMQINSIRQPAILVSREQYEALSNDVIRCSENNPETAP